MAAAADGAVSHRDFNLRQDVILIDQTDLRMSPEDVRAALTVYVSAEELRTKTRALEDSDFSADAVDAALGKWCDELYAEKQQANADVLWLTKSAEELQANPPLFRWASAKKSGLRAGIEPDSEKNIELMFTDVRKILRQLGAPLEPPYTGLSDVLKVAEVISDHWDVGSWKQVWTLLRKFLALIGHDQQHEYLHVYLTQKCYFSAPKNLQAVLSEREAAGVRAKVQELEPKVMEFLGTGDAQRWIERRGKNNGHSLTQHYLLGLFLVGGSPDWVPVRCDPPNLVYKDPRVDLKKCKGYIDSISETECTIHYNYLNKVLPEEKAKSANLTIDVGKTNPPLAKLLWTMKPHVTAIAGGQPAGPFYMYMKEEQFGQRIKPSDYSKRGERLATALCIEGELKNKIKNCTAARYLSAKEDGLFTDEEVKERCLGRGQKPPTDGIAKAHYKAGSLPEFAPGSTVSVSGLQSPRVAHLNDHFGTVLEYVSDKERYRIEFSEDEIGLVRAENLSLVLSVADIASLQSREQPPASAAADSEAIDLASSSDSDDTLMLSSSDESESDASPSAPNP
jgi:hypothetical protein